MSVIKCKAAVLWGPNQPLSMEEIEVAPPKKDEVRIKILVTCPCHTDTAIIQGQGGLFGKIFPMILGHESCGVIESVGEGVTEFAPGDMVVPVPLCQCRTCPHCQTDKTNVCLLFPENHAKGLMPDGTTRFTCKGTQVHHFLGVTTFSEYTVLPACSVTKLKSSDVPIEVASLFGCCFTTGYGSVVNIAKVPAGSSAAVFGLGAIGLSAVMGLKDAGASKIIAVDINESKFEIAKKLGATHVVNPKTEDAVKAIEAINGGLGVDFTFECAGTQQTARAAILASNFAYGVTVLIGLLPGGQEISIDPAAIVSGRTVRGGFEGGVKMCDWIPEALEKFKKSGSYPMQELITHRFKFDQINEAVEAMKQGGVRCAVEIAGKD